MLNEDYAYPATACHQGDAGGHPPRRRGKEAMITDPVYEGKSMQGMIDLVQKRIFPEGVQGALRPSRRRARAERLQLYLPQWLRTAVPRDH